MSVIEYTEEDSGEIGVAHITWTPLTTNDTGRPLRTGRLLERTVQVLGDFGSNATVTIQGSNDLRAKSDPDNAVWFTVNDPFDDPVTFTAAGAATILEAPTFIRPSVTSGTDPSLTIILCAKRS